MCYMWTSENFGMIFLIKLKFLAYPFLVYPFSFSLENDFDKIIRIIEEDPRPLIFLDQESFQVPITKL